MQYKTISIICPIYNEKSILGDFVQSIVDQDYDKSAMEVLLIDGALTTLVNTYVVSLKIFLH